MKKTKLFPLVLAISAVFIMGITSCKKKEKETTPENLDPGKIQYTVNGITYKASTQLPLSSFGNADVADDFKFNENGSFIHFYLDEKMEDKTYHNTIITQVNFDSPEDTVVLSLSMLTGNKLNLGTYPLCGEGNLEYANEEEDVLCLASFKRNSVFLDSVVVGSVTIKEIDMANKTISGTFQFTDEGKVGSVPEVAEITNGRFEKLRFQKF